MNLKIAREFVPVLHVTSPDKELLAKLLAYPGQNLPSPPKSFSEPASPGGRKRATPLRKYKCFSRFLYPDELELAFDIHSDTGALVICCH